MKTILYIRSNEDYSSYQKQEKALYAYCNKNNLQVVTRPFTDNSLDNDDTIHKMFEYCINNKGFQETYRNLQISIVLLR